METMLIIFCCAVSALSYTYFAYPALLLLMRQERLTNDDPAFQPTVSVIIPFYNEEQWVIRKMEDTLAWNFPSSRLQIIAVSDGSVDDTVPLLRRYRGRVDLIVNSPRKGKPTALNRGAAGAKGEILVFPDATVLVHPDAVQ